MKHIVVVIPVAAPDYHLAVKLLKWIKAIHRPQFDFPLIVFPARSLGLAEQNNLAILVNQMPQGRLIENPEEYEHPENGYASAANHMLLMALKMMEEFFPGHPMLWCEADCTPMRSSWMYEIEKEYYQNEKPFMGDFHSPSEIPHMTGNAVYPANWRELAPSLLEVVDKSPEWGWDSKCAHETVPQMHHAASIQQIWTMPRFNDRNLKNIHPQTALFHRCKDGTLIDTLAARSGIPPIPLGEKIAGPVMSIMAKPGKTAPHMEIFIVTFARDQEFLSYCLRSIQRYGMNIGGVTIAVPSHERGGYTSLPAGYKIVYFDEPKGKGMLKHLAVKTRADEFCPDADVILHVDPDCMFWEPFQPQDFAPWNKPTIVRERYDVVLNPNRKNWQQVTQNATGIKCPYETMVRHPQCHVRAVYKRTREIIEAHTGRAFDDYVLDGRNEFPQTYCEFNALGAVALQEFSDLYTIEDYDRIADAEACGQDSNGSWQYIYRQGRDKLVETWSHGGVGQYAPLFEKILQGKRPPYVVK